MLPARLGVPRLLRCRVVGTCPPWPGCEHREGARWVRSGKGVDVLSVGAQALRLCPWALSDGFSVRSGA